MIKSKLDARERALELAVDYYKCDPDPLFDSTAIVEIAKKFESFLISDTELPETQSDTELVKAFLEVMNSELEKKCKPNITDYEEMLKAIQSGNTGISAEMPCESTTE